MNKSVIARACVGVAAVASVGVATIVTAANASAQLSISASPSYCIGSTYAITLPAADAAALIAGYPNADAIVFSAKPTAGGYTHHVGEAAYVAGQDVTAQWTPMSAQTWNIYARPAGAPADAGSQGPMPVVVVESAPAGSSCTPTTGGNPPPANSGSAGL
ncbi:hypothetical protein [Nocardia sp. NPDC058666]|uniref:hypothetical protein n=1 Tax=Nocardia sp. NPDC058666 TaxID=3346587 RepID=UPI00365F6C9E